MENADLGGKRVYGTRTDRLDEHSGTFLLE